MLNYILLKKKKKRPKQLFLVAGRRDFAPFSLVRLSLAFSHALHLAILKRLFHLQCVTTRVWGLRKHSASPAIWGHVNMLHLTESLGEPVKSLWLQPETGMCLGYCWRWLGYCWDECHHWQRVYQVHGTMVKSKCEWLSLKM